MLRTFYLFFCIIASALLSAQIGVNNPSPEQALDVAGKVAIGDDATTPTEGTLRFNTTTEHFEGYDGTEWKSLTNVPALSGGAIPAGALPVYGETSPISANDEYQNFTMRYGDGAGSFVTVPANTFLIITWASFRDNDINPAADVILGRVGPRTSTGSFFVPNSPVVYLSGNLAETVWTQSSLSPLVIVPAGQRLSASNSRFSEDIVHGVVRGFLVPDLSY